MTARGFGCVVLLAVAGLAVACRSGASAPAGQPLTGTSWRAEEIDGRAVGERTESTLTLDSAGRIAGKAACNRYFGTAELGQGTLRLKPAGTTRMACAPEVMEEERRFLAALGEVTAYRQEAGKLLLVGADGRVRVRLAPATAGRGSTAPSSGELSFGPAPLAAHAFDCDSGPGFVIVSREDAIDLVVADGRQRLLRVPSASGARYAASGTSVWNKGREAMLEVDGRSVRCVENRPRSIMEDARARGAEFRATGNEPGWTWELFATAWSSSAPTAPSASRHRIPRGSAGRCQGKRCTSRPSTRAGSSSVSARSRVSTA